MATTSPDNIRTPNSGDQYALVQDMGILADTVQNALIKRANAYVGTGAQRVAFENEAPVGTLWSDEDGDRKVWKKGATEWEALNPDSDTGWVNLSYTSGYSSSTAGQLRARKKDGVLYYQGGASKTSGYFSGEETVCNTVPSNLRPDVNVRTGAAGAAQRNGIFLVTSDGRVILGMNQAVQGNSSWLSSVLVHPAP